MPKHSIPRAILTDVEGTTTPIAFVKDVLFPYARAHIAQFVAARRGTTDVDKALAEVAVTAGCSSDDDACLVRTVIEWIDTDSKATALKTLQGMIWAAGYADGSLQAPVYPDAAAGLRRWHARGHPLFVYSSGSTQAQQLLFGHSDQGSLLGLFSGYFDTTSGGKRDVTSYRNIATALARDAAEIVFLSDVTAELDAARAAGMATCWIIRGNDIAPTTAELAANTHPIAHDFTQVAI